MQKLYWVVLLIAALATAALIGLLLGLMWIVAGLLHFHVFR